MSDDTRESEEPSTETAAAVAVAEPTEPESGPPARPGRFGWLRHPLARVGIVVAVGVAVVAAISFAGRSEPSKATGDPLNRPATAADIGQLADAAGCTPIPRGGKIKGFAQAACTKPDGTKYTFLTFDTPEDQKGWVQEEEGYGGILLIGRQWVVVSNAVESVMPISDLYGGRVTDGNNITPR